MLALLDLATFIFEFTRIVLHLVFNHMHSTDEIFRKQIDCC